MGTVLKFDLVLKEIPVILTMKDDQRRNCVLRELDGERKGQYLEKIGSMMEFEGGEVKNVKSFSGLESTLLALCLYDDKGVLLPEKDIQAFPATVQTALFNEAQKLSGLEESSKAEAKNE